jgi:hypothetical protein
MRSLAWLARSHHRGDHALDLGLAALTKTQADFTSLTTGANTIILASGNPDHDGISVGDVIRANFCPTSRTMRKTCASRRVATTITVAETLVVNAVADTTCSITRPGKRLINPATRLSVLFHDRGIRGRHRPVLAGARFRLGLSEAVDGCRRADDG